MGTRAPNGLGSIVKRSPGSGRTGYRAPFRYIDPDTGDPGRAWVYGKTHDEIKDKARALADELRRNGRPSAGGGAFTTAAYLEEWVSVHSKLRRWKSDNTARRYRDAITTHAVPYFRGTGVKLGKLRAVDVARFLLHLETVPGRRAGTVLSASARAVTLTALRVALDHAVNTKPVALIPSNPARDVPRPAGADTPDTPRRALTATELRAVLAAADEAGLGAHVRVLLLTGGRVSDVAPLRWADVDLEAGRARVRKAKNQPTGRVVTLTPGAVQALREHRRRQAADQLAAHVWVDAGAVFTRTDGSPITPAYLSELIRRRCPFTAHYLRHTYITAAAEHPDVPLATLAEQVGHQDPGYMLKRYGSPTDKGRRILADTVDGLLEGVGDPG